MQFYDFLHQASLSMEAERLRGMDSCPCSLASNKNFLKKNKETVGNTFLIKNHIYKNLYSWDLSIPRQAPLKFVDKRKCLLKVYFSEVYFSEVYLASTFGWGEVNWPQTCFTRIYWSYCISFKALRVYFTRDFLRAFPTVYTIIQVKKCHPRRNNFTAHEYESITWWSFTHKIFLAIWSLFE